MAGISVLFVTFLLMFLLGCAVIALVLLVISMVLFAVSKRHARSAGYKVGAVVTLIFGILAAAPPVVMVILCLVGYVVDEGKKAKEIAAIENKAVVSGDEWREGFEYNGDWLVPVPIFMNSDSYKHYGDNQNLYEIGAVVQKYSNDYYSLYELVSDSDYPIYYVWVEGFAGGEYYSRTFVKREEYDSVLDFYSTCPLAVKAQWSTAPAGTELSNRWVQVKTDITEYRQALMQLADDVLSDVSGKYRVRESVPEGYDEIAFRIQSEDGVFRLDLTVGTGEDGRVLYLNEYRVSDEIVEKYEKLLDALVETAEGELTLEAVHRKTGNRLRQEMAQKILEGFLHPESALLLAVVDDILGDDHEVVEKETFYFIPVLYQQAAAGSIKAQLIQQGMNVGAEEVQEESKPTFWEKLLGLGSFFK